MFSFKTTKLDPAGTMYKLFVPIQAVGANKVFFDMFNGSSKSIEVASIVPVMSGSVAVSGTLAVDMYLTRTTAIGTGGTGATQEGTALNAATFSKLDSDSKNIPSGLSARLTPGGGATAGAVLGFLSKLPEETNASTYILNDMIQSSASGGDAKITIPPGTGIRVVQGAVASVGNVAFDVLFQVID